MDHNIKSKIVIRRLPPTLPAEIFKENLSKWSDYICSFDYVQGKVGT